MLNNLLKKIFNCATKKNRELLDSKEKVLNEIYSKFRKMNAENKKNLVKVQNIFSRRDVQVKIEYYSIQSFLIIEGIKIFYDNDKIAFFPFENASFYQKNPSGIKKARDEFLKIGWFFPAYIVANPLKVLAAELKSQSIDSKMTILESILLSLYNLEYLSRMYSERYAKVAYVSYRKEIILESIEAFSLGLNHCAITTLIPVIEGTIRDIADLNGEKSVDVAVNKLLGILRDYKKKIKTESFLKDFDYFPPEFKADGFFDDFHEQFQLLEGLIRYMNEFLYKDSQLVDDIGNLNRHSILHGFFKTYDYPFNFVRLISILDLLVFVIMLKTNFSSNLPPDQTEKSIALFDHLERLSSIELKNTRH
ncbi:hypothetical protein [Leptospira sp. B5-022]|uniref:hypothetical protein n=2 Tax=unclassified Leptospira TaxID=2633828 RepID=UPI0002BE814A|nr:hypothetical protein [Leptospira sp. B5-022]EMK01226.1 hypothetical protein LEP1GSC192_1158 [Leptospira sp. B5-022]